MVGTAEIQAVMGGDVSPLLASPQGGVAASQENAAQQPNQTQTGWFSIRRDSENHPVLARQGGFATFC